MSGRRDARELTRPLLALAFLATILGLAGCGSRAPVSGDQIQGDTLTIYTSLPFDGASRVSGQATLNGARLALTEAGSRVGNYRIALKVLDDATYKRGEWDPGQTTLNARQAVLDADTVGYIGELNSGATAVSLPILNHAGIPQISPSSTAVGLTSAQVGSAPGEPDKYYPSGLRTFARIVPNDAIQSAVQVKLQQQEGCQKTYVLDDGEVDGADMAASFMIAARRAGLKAKGPQEYDPKATDYRSLATGIARTGANCVLLSAITDSNAVLLTRQLAAAMPSAKLFGCAGLAESTYADPQLGGLPAALDSRVLITIGVRTPRVPAPEAARFSAMYVSRYGPVQPYSLLGYEAMGLMLNAISRASAGGTQPVTRSAVRRALMSTRDRASVLGTYSIDRNGDTSLRTYGVYRIVDGELRFWKALPG